MVSSRVPASYTPAACARAPTEAQWWCFGIHGEEPSYGYGTLAQAEAFAMREIRRRQRPCGVVPVEMDEMAQLARRCPPDRIYHSLDGP